MEKCKSKPVSMLRVLPPEDAEIVKKVFDDTKRHIGRIIVDTGHEPGRYVTNIRNTDFNFLSRKTSREWVKNISFDLNL